MWLGIVLLIVTSSTEIVRLSSSNQGKFDSYVECMEAVRYTGVELFNLKKGEIKEGTYPRILAFCLPSGEPLDTPGGEESWSPSERKEV